MFKSLNNFRALGGPLHQDVTDGVDPNPLKVNVYRSARPDNINKEDLTALHKQLHVQYFLDLRSFESEYKTESGLKLLDKHAKSSTVHVVDMKIIEEKKLTKLQWLNLNDIPNNMHENSLDHLEGICIKHMMISLVGYDFVKKWLNDERHSLMKKIWTHFLVFLYLYFGLHYFVDYFEYEVKNSGILVLYKSLIDYSRVAIRSALQLIIQEGKVSFVICCHAGKDRTGIISAILLSICGFDKETIAADYEQTERGLSAHSDELMTYNDEMKTAPKTVMLDLLNYIDEKYGSMKDYLTSIGVSVSEQEEIRKIVKQN